MTYSRLVVNAAESVPSLLTEAAKLPSRRRALCECPRFVRMSENRSHDAFDDIKRHVQILLGRHKAPVHRRIANIES